MDVGNHNASGARETERQTDGSAYQWMVYKNAYRTKAKCYLILPPQSPTESQNPPILRGIVVVPEDGWETKGRFSSAPFTHTQLNTHRTTAILVSSVK